MTKDVTTVDAIKKLGLKSHPEGGYYRETFRDMERRFNDFPHQDRGERTEEELPRGAFNGNLLFT